MLHAFENSALKSVDNLWFLWMKLWKTTEVVHNFSPGKHVYALSQRYIEPATGVRTADGQVFF